MHLSVNSQAEKFSYQSYDKMFNRTCVKLTLIHTQSRTPSIDIGGMMTMMMPPNPFVLAELHEWLPHRQDALKVLSSWPKPLELVAAATATDVPVVMPGVYWVPFTPIMGSGALPLTSVPVVMPMVYWVPFAPMVGSWVVVHYR